MKEVWQPVKGYEDLYLVSNQGNVKRTGQPVWSKANGGCWQTRRERVLKQRVVCRYLMVWLYKDTKRKGQLVHRLVAEAFVPGDSSLTVNHIDGNPMNNTSGNLEWMTRSDNLRDRRTPRQILMMGSKAMLTGRVSSSLTLSISMDPLGHCGVSVGALGDAVDV